MAYNFLACDRDQPFLLPPDLRDWLPADHLAWFVLDVVDQLDLGPFLAAYRADGHGRAAYQPWMLLGGAAVCLLHRDSLLPADRAALPRGPRLPRPCRQQHTRSRDHRALPGPPRAGPGRAADPVPEAVRSSRHGAPWPGRVGRHQGGRQRRRSGQPHPGHARGAGRRAAPAGCPRRIGPRTSSTAPPAATGCRGRWPAGPSGWPGCSGPRSCWKPRPPPVSGATSSGSRSWPLQRGRAASDPEPISGRGVGMRPQPGGGRQHHRPRQPLCAWPRAHAAGLQRPGGRHPRAGSGRRRADPAGQRRPAAGADAGRHPHHPDRRRHRRPDPAIGG
jgi:hypothetical protein